MESHKSMKSLDRKIVDSILLANTAIGSDGRIGNPTAKHVTRAERARGALTGALTGLDSQVGNKGAGKDNWNLPAGRPRSKKQPQSEMSRAREDSAS